MTKYIHEVTLEDFSLAIRNATDKKFSGNALHYMWEHYQSDYNESQDNEIRLYVFDPIEIATVWTEQPLKEYLKEYGLDENYTINTDNFWDGYINKPIDHIDYLNDNTVIYLDYNKLKLHPDDDVRYL